MKRIESDGRQGTNDFDFPKDTECKEENKYSGYQGYNDFDNSFNDSSSKYSLG